MRDSGGLGADHYRARADKCIYLADRINDDEAAAALRNLAMTYRIKARRINEAGVVEGP